MLMVRHLFTPQSLIEKLWNPSTFAGCGDKVKEGLTGKKNVCQSIRVPTKRHDPPRVVVLAGMRARTALAAVYRAADWAGERGG